MKLLVDIGNKQDVFEIHKPEVMIGADPDCDIVLNQPGLGRKQLKVIERDGSFTVVDFGSGAISKLNGKSIPPNQEVEFNSIFPIEVAGVLISLGDESSTEESLDQSLNKLSSSIEKTNQHEALTPILKEEEDLTELSDEELIQKIQTSYKKSGTNRISDFKPNISDPFLEEQKSQNTNSSINIKASGTGSHKINLKNVGTGSKKIKVSPKKGMNRRRRKVERDRSIGPILILSMTLIISGGIYYLKFVQPNSQKAFKEVKVVESKENKITYKTIIHKNLSPMEPNYKKFFKNKVCNTTDEKLVCNSLGLDKSKKSGALIVNSKLYVGIHLKDLSALESNLTPNIVRDGPHLKRLIDKEYKEDFDYNEFKTNNFSPPQQIYHFNSSTYKYLNLSLYKFLNEEFKNILTGPKNLNEVFIFTFDTPLGEIEIQSYINLKKIGIKYLFEDISYQKSVIKDFYIYKLNKSIEEFFSRVGDTHLNKWKVELLKEDLSGKEKEDLLLSFEKGENCNNSTLKSFCEYLMETYKLFNVYVYLDEEKISIFYNASSLLNKFKTTSKKDYKYNQFEKRRLLDYLKEAKINISAGALLKNDFVFDKYENQMFTDSLMFDEFLKIEMSKLFEYVSDQKRIFLVFYNNDPKQVNSYLSIPIAGLKDLIPSSLSSERNFLHRSNIPSYELVFKKLKIKKVVFEDFFRESLETQ